MTATVTVTMASDVRVHTDASSFELPAWRRLLARDPDRHIFGSPEWNKVWWEEFAHNKELFVLSVERDGETVGVVPLYRKIDEGRRLLRFVGGIDLTDYIGPICAPSDRAFVADRLVAWLAADEIEWDELDAHHMPVPLHFADHLVERADAAGLTFRLDQEETSAILRLPASFDDYLTGLDGKERHELKRKQRRIARDHPDARFRTATQETLDADLRTFVDMHQGSEGMKGHFLKPEIATFFERVARAFMPLGWLRLDFLEVGDTAIATTFGFRFEKAFCLYNSAYDLAARRLSPGLILVTALIEGAIEEGYETFDFLRGPERYKYQLGAQAVPLHNVRIVRDAV